MHLTKKENKMWNVWVLKVSSFVKIDYSILEMEIANATLVIFKNAYLNLK